MNPGERRFTHECGRLDHTQRRRARRGGSEVRLGEPMVYFSAFSASLRDSAFFLSLLRDRVFGRAPSQSLGSRFPLYSSLVPRCGVPLQSLTRARAIFMHLVHNVYQYQLQLPLSELNLNASR